MKPYRFVIPGPVVPKGRARSTRNGGHYTPPRTRAYEATVKLLGGAARPSEWPLSARYAVEINVYVASQRRCDVDNIAKSILDGLNGVAWNDDCQVDDLHVRRWLNSRRDDRSVHVWIEVIDGGL